MSKRARNLVYWTGYLTGIAALGILISYENETLSIWVTAILLVAVMALGSIASQWFAYDKGS